MRFVEPFFSTPDGRLRTMIFPGNGQRAIDHGFHVDGSSLNLSPIEDSDVLIKPVKDRKLVLKEDNGHSTAIYLSEIGEQQLSARQLLQRQLSELEARGYSLKTGVELEFYVTSSDRKQETEAYVANDFPLYSFFKRIVPQLKAQGLPIDKVHHEAGAGQYEFVLAADDPRTTADKLLLLKQALKRVAASEGITVTFAPKPFPDRPGNGLHTHLSLWRGDENAFKGEKGLSEEGKSFVAGLLARAKEISRLVAPSAQSYQRLVPGQEAPVKICWGYKNRSVMVRVPPAKDRMEFRATDPSCNPYLAFLALIQSGMEGIELDRELEEPLGANSYQQDDDAPTLPSSLQEAQQLMADSEFVRGMAPSLVSSVG